MGRMFVQLNVWQYIIWNLSVYVSRAVAPASAARHCRGTISINNFFSGKHFGKLLIRCKVHLKKESCGVTFKQVTTDLLSNMHTLSGTLSYFHPTSDITQSNFTDNLVTLVLRTAGLIDSRASISLTKWTGTYLLKWSKQEMSLFHYNSNFVISLRIPWANIQRHLHNIICPTLSTISMDIKHQSPLKRR